MFSHVKCAWACVFSCKMRLALFATDDPPLPTRLFFNENACCTNPPRFPHVFSNKLRLAVSATVNLHVTRPTAPGFRIFFQGKRVSHQPFQILCVFTSKTHLAFNVTVNLFDSRRPLPHSLFFQRKRASQDSCQIPRVTFIVFSQDLTKRVSLFQV